MSQSRRDFMKATGAAAASLVMPNAALSDESPEKKRHIVTLSFDDGFKKSSIKTAEIYEKHKLSACINVVASAHMKEFRPPDYPNRASGRFRPVERTPSPRARSHAAQLQTRQLAAASAGRSEGLDSSLLGCVLEGTEGL